MINQSDLEAFKSNYNRHLTELSQSFNEWSDERGLPVHMNVDKVVASTNNNLSLPRVVRYNTRVDDNGIVHITQLKTAIDCIDKLLNASESWGHVVGAMQSGKTTTSLALQWAGPILYLMRGIRAYPFYLISNQTNHEDQTTTELRAFLDYYGDIEIMVTDPSAHPHSIDVVFQNSPTLSTYRDHILRDQSAVFNVPQLGDEICRRVGGSEGIQRVAERCRRANELGYQPLMIIDEPQYGASDYFAVGEDGLERRPCVLAQIFNRIEQELGTDRNDHLIIGLSATPFELNDLQRVWEVRQYLTINYSGFNFFNGQAISNDIDITPPRTLSQSAFALEIGVPFLADISISAYHGPAANFNRLARRIGFRGTHVEYRDQVDTALRNAIYNVLDLHSNNASPVGLCIRAFNNNIGTENIIRRLALDPLRIQVLSYYGNSASGISIKRLISQRPNRDLPYLVLVTSRARMADAFPIDCQFFMDFSQKASDLNALLQGLLGRACGYNKNSTVILSDQNIGIVDAYVATNGGYVHRTSRHTVVVGGFRRGAPTTMIKLHRDMNDAMLRQFFREIDEVVEAHLPETVANIRGVSRARGGRARTGPILRIAQTIGVFEHIEQPQNRTVLFPQLPTGFRVARASDQVRHPRRDVFLRYSLDPEGNCRYTFRWTSRDVGAQGGAAGRARGQRDAAGLESHMEPTVYVEKYDTISGNIINDQDSDQQRPGKWRAFMVTFPLLEPVREIRAADVAYPTETCVYSSQMTEEEKIVRDGG